MLRSKLKKSLFTYNHNKLFMCAVCSYLKTVETVVFGAISYIIQISRKFLDSKSELWLQMAKCN